MYLKVHAFMATVCPYQNTAGDVMSHGIITNWFQEHDRESYNTIQYNTVI